MEKKQAEKLVDEMWKEQIESRKEPPSVKEFLNNVIESLFKTECEEN